MLLEILVTVPSLILAEIAWCVRFAVALTCMTILFALAIAAVGLYCRRAEPRHFSQPECRATCRAAYPANSAAFVTSGRPINSLARIIKWGA
jgi:hypothetical protein